MRILDDIHSWNVEPRLAIELQKILACKLNPGRLPSGVSHVAGVDVSVADERMASSIVVYSIVDKRLIECVSELMPVGFPYVPGLLSFREGPAILSALRRVKSRVDIVMLDGHGIAHPRGLGIAAHIGLWIDVPTVGVAKSILVGRYGWLGHSRGSKAQLLHNGTKIGYALRTRDNVKPVFVSCGNRVGLEGALRITCKCCDGYRLPEPVRLAHTAAALARQSVPDIEIVVAINRVLEKRHIPSR